MTTVSHGSHPTPLIDPEDYVLLQQLREREPAQNVPVIRPALGQRMADTVAAVVGSWRFIVTQSILLSIWIALNITAFIQHWDPYPFILLNLVLSFQAAYTAPIIMMSQNRQADIDRLSARHDYEVNMKAELEIELLHDKLDRVNRAHEQSLLDIANAIQEQRKQLDRIESCLTEQITTLADQTATSGSPQPD